MSSSIRPSWHVYVVRCADGSLYTGITTDVARRLLEHDGAAGTGRRGAAYTRSRRPVRLVHVEAAADRSAATRTEIAIKRLSRAAKERLVARCVPGADAIGAARTAGADACVHPSCKPPRGNPSSCG